MSDIKIQPSATGSATVTLTAPATGTARTVTLPDSTDTLAVNSDVTNKLPLAGGTMTGNLTVATSGVTTNTISTTSTGAYAELIIQDGNAGYSWQTRSDNAQSTGTGSFLLNDRDTSSFPIVIKEGNATDTLVLSGGNLLLGGGVAIGGTGTANTLDDYEEGTFTPSLTFGGGATGMTYNAQQGSYVKVGKMCYISLRITLTSKGSSSGGAIITGLPFTSANIAGNFSKGGMAFANNWYGSVAGTQHHIHTVDGNTSTIQIRRLDDGGNYQTFTDSHMDDNVDMIFCMTMRTA